MDSIVEGLPVVFVTNNRFSKDARPGTPEGGIMVTNRTHDYPGQDRSLQPVKLAALSLTPAALPAASDIA
jgi:hypothetical protein